MNRALYSPLAGLLAVAAMNGSLFDTTFNFFIKYKYSHTYDAIVATPLGAGDIATGEVAWALMRGAIYSTAFLVTMLLFGLVSSWWALLVVPAAVLIGFAFAGAGLAATTFMRSWVDFDYVTLALIPLFLFSATFFPLRSRMLCTRSLPIKSQQPEWTPASTRSGRPSSSNGMVPGKSHIEKSARPAENLEALEVFTARLQIVPFSAKAAAHFGQIRAQLARLGTPAGGYDMLIGAHARSEGLILVTNNVREFQRMPGLTIENWAT
jgi:hypothetical protein